MENLIVTESNLSEVLTSLVGYDILIEKFNITKTGYIDFMSQSLLEHTGIMKEYYEDFRITQFSNNTTTIKGKYYYWSQINFRFQYKSGGENGHYVGQVFYDYENQIWLTQKEIENKYYNGK